MIMKVVGNPLIPIVEVKYLYLIKHHATERNWGMDI
jgi:hypothetical protein